VRVTVKSTSFTQLLINIEDAPVASLKSEVASIRAEVDEQRKELRAVNSKVDTLTAKVNTLSVKVNSVDSKLDRILVALSSMPGMCHLHFLLCLCLKHRLSI